MRRRTVIFGVVLIGVSVAPAQDWAGLHNALIKFYRYQRSGLKPTTANATGTPCNPFYTHTATDGHYPHSNDAVDGGWYDAGDFVKFGLPQGYAVCALLLGYDVFPDVYDDRSSSSDTGKPNGVPDILDEAKVGTDYLINCVQSSSRIALDVGDGQLDHQSIYGESGYENSTRLNNRQVKVWCTGADAPGFYAAALALMSMLYKPYDATYAATCLQKAKDGFTFCIGHQSVGAVQYDKPENGGLPFYSTSTWEDKMALGAVELFRATADSTYLTWAQDLMSTVGQHYDVVGYAHCGDFAAFELCRLGKTAYSSAWTADVSTAINRVVGGNCLVTGATVNSTTWGVCRTAANAALSAALLYMVRGDKQDRDFATNQLRWVAGFAPYAKSYITQFGNGYPNSPHHRNDLNITAARLAGGIVSGPTALACQGDVSLCNWAFSDTRDAARNTEPALDYNAAAIGAVAFVRWYLKPTTTVHIENALTATPATVDLNIATQVTTSATLDKSASWKVTLTGVTSGAVKTFSGSGTAVSAAWTGDADAGAFVPGEVVGVVLDVPNLWTVQVPSMSQTSFFLANLKTQPFLPDDKEIDNFEDSAVTTNLLGGKWGGFSDQSEGVAGGASQVPSLSLDVGKDGTRGLLFRLVRNAGAQNPYCGIRTTFNAAGSIVKAGPVTSIVFDVYPTSDYARLTVELEQPTITDRAYFGFEASLGLKDTWYRVRVPVGSLAQPSWKSTARALTLSSITALRFCGFGVGNERYIIDNVRVQGLSIGNAVRQDGLRPPPGDRRLVIRRSGAGPLLVIPAMSAAGAGRLRVSVIDMSGHCRGEWLLDNATGGILPVPRPAGGVLVVTCRSGDSGRVVTETISVER